MHILQILILDAYFIANWLSFENEITDSSAVNIIFHIYVLGIQLRKQLSRSCCL